MPATEPHRASPSETATNDTIVGIPGGVVVVVVLVVVVVEVVVVVVEVVVVVVVLGVVVVVVLDVVEVDGEVVVVVRGTVVVVVRGTVVEVLGTVVEVLGWVEVLVSADPDAEAGGGEVPAPADPAEPPDGAGRRGAGRGPTAKEPPSAAVVTGLGTVTIPATPGSTGE